MCSDSKMKQSVTVTIARVQEVASVAEMEQVHKGIVSTIPNNEMEDGFSFFGRLVKRGSCHHQEIFKNCNFPVHGG